jgi:glycine cleavage system H protein
MTDDELRISWDHVWVRSQPDGAQVGISDFAAEALGKIIYVELPEVGTEVARGEPFATVESGKASIELPAPASGRVIRVNEELENRPDLINEDSLVKGWIALLTIADAAELDELLTKPDYDLFVAGGEKE